MGNVVLKNLLERKIDIFVNTFGLDSNTLFKRDEKLIHPLEYGNYRERCFKELLNIIINKKTNIADGFIITAFGSISTQCDIIVYQSDTIPLIENGIANFFPIEIVNGVGEIKSNLSKTKFREALRKLSDNKKLAAERKGTLETPKMIFEEPNEILSFLVCNKLEFDIKTLDFEEIYEDIPSKYWHNAVLALEDGLLTYNLSFKKLPDTMKKRFLELGGKNNHEDVIWEYPVHIEDNETYQCISSFIKADPDDKYKHIIKFLIIIQQVLKEQYQYKFDFIEYLDLSTYNIFK